MDTDSDSGASHVSATPPKKPTPSPFRSSFSKPKVRGFSLSNPISEPNASKSLPESSKPPPKRSNPFPSTEFSTLPASTVKIHGRRKSARPVSGSRKDGCSSHPPDLDSVEKCSKRQKPSTCPATIHQESASVPQVEVGCGGRGGVGGDRIDSVKIHRHSTRNSSVLGSESSGGLRASHLSKLQSLSKLAKRRNLSLNPAEVEKQVNLAPLQAEIDGGHCGGIRGVQIDADTTGIRVESEQRTCDQARVIRNHPNLIPAAVTPMPLKRPKCVNEGNFVKLNINGYGRKKFGKKGGTRKVSSSAYRGRKSHWRSRCKPKPENEPEQILCEEDGLVSVEQLPQQQKSLKYSKELVDQAVKSVQDDPSDQNLKILLKLTHGYDSFRNGQLAAIKQVIAGQSTMLVLPTGAGKSLCYQLPALVFPGATLVVSPLVALMVDQLRRLPPMLQGGLLSSNQTSQEISETLERLLAGNIKVLFVSPERFVNEEFLSKCRSLPLISLVVVDEAHCLSEWSHNFRPSYLRLRASLLRSKLNADCVLAMTATATTKTLHAVMSALEIPSANLIQSSQIRENLQLFVTLSGNRMKDLIMLMKSSSFVEVRSIIIYCKFQSETDIVSKYLCDNNISAKSYHSGVPAKDRNRIQELFCLNKIRVVVATVAFGMGLDKSDVGAVIHYSLPESLEEYVQETGRAGRDGRLSCCHLLLEDTTYFKLRSLLYSDGVDEYALNRLLCEVFKNDMKLPGNVFSLGKESASRKFDVKEEVILTILTYLELGEVQYLQLLPLLNVTCNLYFHKTSPALLSSKDIMVATILKKSDNKQGHYVFDIPTVANAAGITISYLSNQLQKLKLLGEITYEVKDPAFCYMIVKNPSDICSLTTHLTRWLAEVESCKVRKLDEMFNAAVFAAKVCNKTCGCSKSLHTPCLQRKIMDYFSRDHNAPLTDLCNKMGLSSPFLRADIKVFFQSNSHTKFTPRAIARIMHGIPSPAFPSATWSKCHFWGRYSQIDFSVVMEAARMELMNFAGKGAAL